MIRNRIVKEEEYAVVYAANNNYTFKVSFEDLTAIKQYRWRVFFPYVVSEEGGKLLKLAHYLLNKHPDDDVIFKNKDYLDFRRTNLKPKVWGGQRPHTITEGEKYSWLHLGICDVKIDTEDIERIDRLTWSASRSTYGGIEKILIRANWKTKKIFLHRFIMRATRAQLVGYLDGDDLNCSKENLFFIDRGTSNKNGNKI
jgi:hypothetical protein